MHCLNFFNFINDKHTYFIITSFCLFCSTNHNWIMFEKRESLSTIHIVFLGLVSVLQKSLYPTEQRSWLVVERRQMWKKRWNHFQTKRLVGWNFFWGNIIVFMHLHFHKWQEISKTNYPSPNTNSIFDSKTLSSTS